MRTLHLYVVGFGRPDLLREQHRLLNKYLCDPLTLTLADNTADPGAAEAMRVTAGDLGIYYFRVPGEKHEHPDALAEITRRAAMRAHWGCLDHDVFPTKPTSVLKRLSRIGFLGMGQTYAPRTGPSRQYLWPGWCFFSRRWLAGRTPNFYGIRGEYKWDDGDCGSLLWPLFEEADWVNLRTAQVAHGYGTLREEDGAGLQSFGYETIDDSWVHFTNGSHWKEIPDPEGRTALILEMLAQL